MCCCGLDAHAHLAGRDTKGRVVTRKGSSLPRPGRDTNFRSRPQGGQNMSQHQSHVATPISPNSIATSKWCHDTTSDHSGAFWSRHQSHVTTLGTPAMPRLDRDTKSVSQHQLVLACGNKNFWSQPSKGQPMSQHQESCSDIEVPVPCRDNKKCIAAQPQLPCSFCVATPKAESRPPNRCPCRDMKIMSRPRTSLS